MTQGKVRYRFVAQTCDEAYHLFERDSDMPVLLAHPGLLLTNIADMPAPAGPDAEFANKILRCVWDDGAATLYASLIPLRFATETLAEVKKQLPTWEFMRTLQAGSVNDSGQIDLLNG